MTNVEIPLEKIIVFIQSMIILLASTNFGAFRKIAVFYNKIMQRME